jgi:hypothetical protein
MNINFVLTNGTSRLLSLSKQSIRNMITFRKKYAKLYLGTKPLDNKT